MPYAFFAKTLIEVLLLGAVSYWLLLLAKETRALRLVKGLLIIGFLWAAAVKFDLGVLRVIFEGVDMPTVMAIAVVVLFRDQLKEVLARLGKVVRFGERLPRYEFFDELTQACKAMADSRTGALIVLQRNDGLGDIVEKGTPLDAKVSAAFLEQIFYKNSPLHDGALVIADGRAAAARCTLPTTTSPEVRQMGLGTRHQAGVGLTEVRDSVVVVVSEEKGSIGYCEGGKLQRYVSPERLLKLLDDAFAPKQKTEEEEKSLLPDVKRVRVAVLTNPRYKLAALVLAFFLWCLNSQPMETSWDITLNPPVSPTDVQRDGEPLEVKILKPDSLVVEDAELYANNLELLQVCYHQLRDPGYLSRRTMVVLTTDQIQRDWEMGKPLECLVKDTAGGMRILAPRTAGAPLADKTVGVDLALLARYKVEAFEIELETEGRLPSGYTAKELSIDPQGRELLVYAGNLGRLKAALKGPLKTIPSIDLKERRDSINGEEIRVVLPPEPSELHTLKENGGEFKALLFYSIEPPASAPARGRRAAEVVQLRQEAAKRRLLLEQQRQDIAIQIQGLLRKPGPTEQDNVTEESWGKLNETLRTAKDREGISVNDLAAAVKVKQELEGSLPRPAAELIALEQDAVEAIDQIRRHNEEYAKALEDLVEAYKARIEPVLEVRAAMKELQGIEPPNGTGPPEGSITALEKRLDEVKATLAQADANDSELRSAEEKPYSEAASALQRWTSEEDRIPTAAAVLQSLLSLDPVDSEHAKRVVALQTKAHDLLVEVREYRGRLSAIWSQDLQLERSRFPALTRAEQARDRLLAKRARLRAEIKLHQLRLERKRYLVRAKVLADRVVPRRRQLLGLAASTLSAEGRDKLSQYLGQEVRDLLRRRLGEEQQLLKGLLEQDKKQRVLLEGDMSAVQERLQALRIELQFERLRLLDADAIDQARLEGLPDDKKEELKTLPPLSAAERQVLAIKVGGSEDKIDGDLEFEQALYELLRASLSADDPAQATLPSVLREYRKSLETYQVLLSSKSEGQPGLEQVLIALDEAIVPNEGSK